MEIQILREFVSLAETCNFQATADELALTQSSLSKHIHKLEEELGVQLFDRTTRSVTLNLYGKEYFEYARKICELNDDSLTALDRLKRGKGAILNIGFMDKHGVYGLVELLAEFSQAHPEIKVNTLERKGEELKELLVSGQADVIFYAERVSTKEFMVERYATDCLAAVLYSGHPLAGAHRIALKDLVQDKIIEHNSVLEMRLLAEACQDERVDLHCITSIYHASTIMKMVREKIGISIMSRECAEEYATPDLVILPITPAVTFDINIVGRRTRGADQASKIFFRFVREKCNISPGEAY